MLKYLLPLVFVANFSLAAQSMGHTASLEVEAVKQNDSAMIRCNIPPGFFLRRIKPGEAYPYCCYPSNFIPRQILVQGEMRPVGKATYSLQTRIGPTAACNTARDTIIDEKLYVDEDARYGMSGPVPSWTRVITLAIVCHDLVNECNIEARVQIDAFP